MTICQKKFHGKKASSTGRNPLNSTTSTMENVLSSELTEPENSVGTQGFPLPIRCPWQWASFSRQKPQHDQKSLKKDFSTVTRHTAESRRPHRKKKKKIQGVCEKQTPQGGYKTPQGTIITSFQAPSLLGRVLMVFAWNWAAKLIKTDFFVPCRGHRLSQTSNFP